MVNLPPVAYSCPVCKKVASQCVEYPANENTVTKKLKVRLYLGSATCESVECTIPGIA